jgi:hypothetical protein
VAGAREEEEEEAEAEEAEEEEENLEVSSSSDMLAMRCWCQYLYFCSSRPHTLVA